MDVLFDLQSEEDFKTVTEDLINNLYDVKYFNGIIDESTNFTAKEELRNLIFKNNVNIDDIIDKLKAKAYDTRKMQIFANIIENNQDKLMYLALINHNSVYGEAVASFDWNLKLVYGTSELKNLYYPILQIALTNIHKSEERHRLYDVNKDMLCKMINALENIDAS